MKLKVFLSILLLVIVETSSQLFLTQAPVASELPKPPDQGSPDGRRPASGRGPCENTALDFTPLLPLSDNGYTGLTLKEHPTFWFYVPYKTNSVSTGRFILREREGSKKPIQRLTFKLQKTPGFVSITIPNTAPPLEKNKQYFWRIVLDCASQNSDQPPYIPHEGLLQRADLVDLETQLKTAKLEERLNLYIQNKIWYDAANDLANVRNFPEVWLKLLKAIGWEKLMQEPISGEVRSIEE